MKTPTTSHKKSEDASPCFECADGTLQPIVQDFKTTLPEGGEITVPDVPMHRCDRCGDLLLGDDGNRKIEAFLDKALNVISTDELEQFLRKYELTQKQASQITGYGEKNISRWVTGRLRPSESVSNFFRLLLADAEGFERLKQKNFQDNQVCSYPSEKRRPDKAEREVV